MSKASMATKALDFLQRGTVLGLLSYTGFQFYQIVENVRSFDLDSPNNPHAQSTYFEETEKKIQEDDMTKAGNDYLDKYRSDDYLKQQVKANVPK